VSTTHPCHPIASQPNATPILSVLRARLAGHTHDRPGKTLLAAKENKDARVWNLSQQNYFQRRITHHKEVSSVEIFRSGIKEIFILEELA
jgi:hypothetical protein